MNANNDYCESKFAFDLVKLSSKKRYALSVAEDFHYSEDVIERIVNATNGVQIDNALASGRKML